MWIKLLSVVTTACNRAQFIDLKQHFSGAINTKVLALTPREHAYRQNVAFTWNTVSLFG